MRKESARPRDVGVGSRPLGSVASPEPSPLAAGDIVCDARLGGLLRHYRRAG